LSTRLSAPSRAEPRASSSRRFRSAPAWDPASRSISKRSPGRKLLPHLRKLGSPGSRPGFFISDHPEARTPRLWQRRNSFQQTCVITLLHCNLIGVRLFGSRHNNPEKGATCAKLSS
jgi:hypothetical protein